MKIQSVRGMHDIFAKEGAKYEFILTQAKDIAHRYAFETMCTPILEFAELFERNLGDGSDVVTKEIYKFKDRGDNELALRPEFTAGVIRAFLQNGMNVGALPKRLFSYGSLFRYDRPQAGRYRQFNQVNYEIIGGDNQMIDVECVTMALNFLKSCGITDCELNINFLGSVETTKKYSLALYDYLVKYKNELSADSHVKLEKNVLRILDSKDKNDHKILESAPVLYDFYSSEDSIKFDLIKKNLATFGANFVVNCKLVRGLDYYTGLVFEFVSKSGLTILGGGRYDNLVYQLDGKSAIPAIGFAAGIERLMLEVKDVGDLDMVGIIYYSENETDYAFHVANQVRSAGHAAQIIYSNANIGKKISKASQLGCNKVVICGPDEKAKNTFVYKEINNK